MSRTEILRFASTCRVQRSRTAEYVILKMWRAARCCRFHGLYSWAAMFHLLSTIFILLRLSQPAATRDVLGGNYLGGPLTSFNMHLFTNCFRVHPNYAYHVKPTLKGSQILLVHRYSLSTISTLSPSARVRTIYKMVSTPTPRDTASCIQNSDKN